MSKEGKVSNAALWAWACAHWLVYLVAYCDGGLRKAMRFGEAKKQKHQTHNACVYNYQRARHRCAQPRCGNAPSTAGLLCDTYNKTTFRQRLILSCWVFVGAIACVI